MKLILALALVSCTAKPAGPPPDLADLAWVSRCQQACLDRKLTPTMEEHATECWCTEPVPGGQRINIAIKPEPVYRLGPDGGPIPDGMAVPGMQH